MTREERLEQIKAREIKTIELKKQGLSPALIAERFGLKVDTIRNVLREYNKSKINLND